MVARKVIMISACGAEGRVVHALGIVATNAMRSGSLFTPAVSTCSSVQVSCALARL